MIPAGAIAPTFTLPTQTGSTFNLAAYRNKNNVLLLFLPAAFTPVCSTELPAAAALQDQFYRDANTVVAAVTADLPAANREWARRCNAANLFVLSDNNLPGAVSRAYGAWLQSEAIPDRASVLIDSRGIVRYAESVGKFGKRSVPALLAMAMAANGSRPSPLQSARMPLDLPVLYVTTSCPHCRAITGLLQRLHGEDLVVVRWVDKDQDGMRSLLTVEPRGLVPLLMYGGKKWVGENEIGPQLSEIASAKRATA